MIRKVIWTYWDPNRNQVNGGFRTKRELVISIALSLELMKKQFEKTELITTTTGKELLIDKYQLPFDSVKTDLDKFDETLDPDLWAYTKIYSYSIQEEPFIHCDNDVYVWDRIPKDKLEVTLLFQNKELLETHKSYERIINEAHSFPMIDVDVMSSHPEWAYNCGVVGVNEDGLDLIKEWKRVVDEYIYHPKNEKTWKELYDRHSHNHLFEQYFISCLIKNNQTKVETLLKDDFMLDVENFKYTHLWGGTKRDEETMERVKNRLYKDFPQYRERIEIPQTYDEIFGDIYRNELWGRGMGSGGGSSPALTFEYRQFLKKFIIDNEVVTVFDYGCGDWQFSKLIDWTGVDYIGSDCVRSIIDTNNKEFGAPNIHFELSDEVSVPARGADLLIIKDVFIHWPDREIKKFLDELLESSKFKFVLITNQVDRSWNEDIDRPGQYHSVDLNKEPFSLNCKEIFRWPRGEKKITYLIER
jgi:hypothetical protein